MVAEVSEASPRPKDRVAGTDQGLELIDVPLRYLPFLLVLHHRAELASNPLKLHALTSFPSLLSSSDRITFSLSHSVSTLTDTHSPPTHHAPALSPTPLHATTLVAIPVAIPPTTIMTVTLDAYRAWSSSSTVAPPSPVYSLEDKYDMLKDIGDGSFGTVALARSRSTRPQSLRRGTLVAIKTMKKTFDTFAQCMELREVIFLKTLPPHYHLVPAYDIFLDPLSKKLHIAMEYMDGNLYQLIKARDHKPLDPTTVKSILYQIIAGLDHIHEHHFFHRDIKPENILVSTSAATDPVASSFRRYSSLVTPPATPPIYSVKIADFGLARETHSRSPYTTYVSTRWYRAPEVLLRAGEYSAPVDMWALGAMAVEIATLKPLFPGGNEVDQVWRVCEMMGSPGSWVNKHGQRMGGGEWKDGIKLAQKLGFSFPKMAPHSFETVLPPPRWSAQLAQLVTWCLMWNPKARPTSRQAMDHDYFADAVDPLRPRTSSSAAKLFHRKSAHLTDPVDRESSPPPLSTRTSSWFRKSLVGRDFLCAPSSDHASSPLASEKLSVPSHRPSKVGTDDDAPSPIAVAPAPTPSHRPVKIWTNSDPGNAAPIPILPSIRPVSPLPNEVTVQVSARPADELTPDAHCKIGRQLSMGSQGNHYADLHRQEAERILSGQGVVKSPTGSQKEGFFSHLRKRARRLSGRHYTPIAPHPDDVEAHAGASAAWSTGSRAHRQSVPEAPHTIARRAADPSHDPHFADLDRALQGVRHSLDATVAASRQPQRPQHAQQNGRHPSRVSSNPTLPRHQSVSQIPDASSTPSARTRHSMRHATNHARYETPAEEDELLDEAIGSAHRAAQRLDSSSLPRAVPRQPARYLPPGAASQTDPPARPPALHMASDPGRTTVPPHAAYLTPSASKDHNHVSFGAHDSPLGPCGPAASAAPTQPVDIPAPAPLSPAQQQMRRDARAVHPQWPTPPYDENDWAAGVAASIFATQESLRL